MFNAGEELEELRDGIMCEEEGGHDCTLDGVDVGFERREGFLGGLSNNALRDEC